MAELAAGFFRLASVPKLKPHYNIAPSQVVATIINRGDNRVLRGMRWGFTPSWAKSPLINARSETVAVKPTYKTAFHERRCLVIADGYYEWQRAGSGKEPHYIYMKSNEVFAFAGLFARHGETDQCLILTCKPNELTMPIHKRMPVIIPPDGYDVWLDPDNQDKGLLVSMLKPYPTELMDEHVVSTFVNRPQNDDPRCIERAA